jgi:D-sedoheptulose 7-phosphate isomerase
MPHARRVPSAVSAGTVTEREDVVAAFEATAALHQAWGRAHADDVQRAAGIMIAALGRGGRILSCGNGGSATDAQHLASELVGRFGRERRAWSAVALTADSAVLTSLGNDYGYDAVFVRQVEAHGRAGDVLVGITTSGASANVTRALIRARELGLTTIALTGRDGGEAGTVADLHLNVPSDRTPRVQEVHRTILHALCELIDKGLQ